MPLEEVDVIDIAQRLPTGELKLVITDSGVTTDSNRRLELLLQKLQTYGTYVSGSEFGADHSGVPLDAVSILVLCRNAPTPDMQSIRFIRLHEPIDRQIPVEFLIFDPTQLR